jgi:hypothetical protein
VEVSPREAPQREGAESADRIKRDQIKREEIRIEKERSLDAARRAEADARKAQFEAQRQHAEKMKAWGEEMRQWEHSEPMVKWRAQMEKWQQQMQEWAHSLAPGERDGEHASPDVAPVPSTPPMPPMPAMPKMPGDGKEKMKMKLKNADPMYGDADPMYEEAQEDLAEADEDVEEEAFAVEVPHVAPPHVNPPHVEIPVIEPPAPPHVSEDQGEIVSKSSFGDIAGDRILEVENFVGSITVRSGDGSEYEVHAVTRVKADTKERIREIAEQLSIADTGAQPNGVERIIVSKPEGLKDRENVTVTIEVVAPREARIKLHQEVGEIRLHGLRGSIEAATRVGSIRAVDVAGRVALDTDVGGIDIAVPKDVSAKIQAKADLGGIQSDLPLEFTKAGGMSMGSSAVGTIGQGDDSISLKAKMGSIRIRSQAPESGRTGGGRPARSQPRPDPRPEPQPTEVF